MEGRSNSLKLIITKLHKVFTEHIMSCARAADEIFEYSTSQSASGCCMECV